MVVIKNKDVLLILRVLYVDFDLSIGAIVGPLHVNEATISWLKSLDILIC